MTIEAWLRNAIKQLKAVAILSARLDAELLLANTLRKPRTYLHTHADETIDPRRHDIVDARLSLRLDRVPLAYILGYKEFYGRPFIVSPAVLIPRPESEDSITLFLNITAQDAEKSASQTLIDIGTGSGCLGITAKLERPQLRVILSDNSSPALKIAEKNADALKADVIIQRQSLLHGQLEPVNYIIANLPYVDKQWDVSPELRHEPAQALFADQKGLSLINKLVEQAPACLLPDGLLFIEADPDQHGVIIRYAEHHGFTIHAQQNYIIVLRLIRR